MRRTAGMVIQPLPKTINNRATCSWGEPAASSSSARWNAMKTGIGLLRPGPEGIIVELVEQIG
jgi:hypothetical protein